MERTVKFNKNGREVKRVTKATLWEKHGKRIVFFDFDNSWDIDKKEWRSTYLVGTALVNAVEKIFADLMEISQKAESAEGSDIQEVSEIIRDAFNKWHKNDERIQFEVGIAYDSKVNDCIEKTSERRGYEYLALRGQATLLENGRYLIRRSVLDSGYLK